MNNPKITVEGTTLHIDVDLTAKPQVSESGKLMVISTTGTNQKIDTDFGELKVGVNVYRKREKGE